MAFATTSQSNIAGQCSNAATVVAKDASGNDTTWPAAGNIVLLAAPSTAPAFAFFTDSVCSSALPGAGLPVAQGSGPATFFFKGYRIPNYTVTAQLTGFTDITQTETVAAASPFKLVFLNAARTTIASGGCSP